MSEQLYVVRAAHRRMRSLRMFVAYKVEDSIVETWAVLGDTALHGVKHRWTAAEAVEISIRRQGLSDQWLVEVVPCD